jgi:hypothetical protein
MKPVLIFQLLTKKNFKSHPQNFSMSRRSPIKTPKKDKPPIDPARDKSIGIYHESGGDSSRLSFSDYIGGLTPDDPKSEEPKKQGLLISQNGRVKKSGFFHMAEGQMDITELKELKRRSSSKINKKHTQQFLNGMCATLKTKIKDDTKMNILEKLHLVIMRKAQSGTPPLKKKPKHKIRSWQGGQLFAIEPGPMRF